MTFKTLLCSLLFTSVAFSADPELSPIGKIFDSQLSSVEREVVSLAEAMPAAKYSFAPESGEFKGARKFGQQVSHIAAVNFLVAAAILGQPTPVDVGADENGPSTVKSKDEIVAFLKKSFAYTHSAMHTITQENLMDQVHNAFGKNMVARLSLATVPQSHSFDHYGQMAVYARICGIVPPASRPRN